jgi:hypothetical protein
MTRKKHNHPFTKEGVLAYIREHRGILYRSNQLARVFKVPAREMRPVVKELAKQELVRSKVIVKTWCYFLHTEEQERLLINQKQAPEWKPLSLDYIRMMDIALAKCKERKL